jgi:hypothetical protein
MKIWIKNLWLVATNKDVRNLVSLASSMFIAAMKQEKREGSIRVVGKDGKVRMANYIIEPAGASK